MLGKTFFQSALAISLLAGVSTVAMAAEPITDARFVSVKSRPRPAYDAVGIRAGSFMVFPKASIGETYNDNIYADDTGKTDDFITTLASSIAVNSNWNRHALNLNAGVSQYLYADSSDEDNFNWNIGGSGRIDVLRSTSISLDGGFAQLHEDRGSPNAPTAASEPTEYFTTTAGGSLLQRFNRLFGEVGATYTKYNFKDSTNLLGATIDQDGRDRDQYTEFLKLGYDVSPDTNLYIRGTLNQRDYRLRPPSPGITLDRNSNGYDVVAGSDFKLSSIMQGGIYAGFQHQTYDDVTLSDTSGLAYGALVNWFVTPLTTVSLTGASAIEETTTAGASGYQSRSINLTVDHELLRNVILTGSLGYQNDSYESISRQDDATSAGLGVAYLLNRNFDLGLNYNYLDRNSDVVGNDYTTNKVALTLTGKL